MMGGFIWDWVDQSRITEYTKAARGTIMLMKTHIRVCVLIRWTVNILVTAMTGAANKKDSNFCINGLVSPDRDVQPELYEVKYVYQNFHFTINENDKHSVSIYNESNFTNLNEYDCKWELPRTERLLIRE